MRFCRWLIQSLSLSFLDLFLSPFSLSLSTSLFSPIFLSFYLCKLLFVKCKLTAFSIFLLTISIFLCISITFYPFSLYFKLNFLVLTKTICLNVKAIQEKSFKSFKVFAKKYIKPFFTENPSIWKTAAQKSVRM